MHPSKSWRSTFRNLNTFHSRNFGEKNVQGGFHFTFRCKILWSKLPHKRVAPENEISAGNSYNTYCCGHWYTEPSDFFQFWAQYNERCLLSTLSCFVTHKYQNSICLFISRFVIAVTWNWTRYKNWLSCQAATIFPWSNQNLFYYIQLEDPASQKTCWESQSISKSANIYSAYFLQGIVFLSLKGWLLPVSFTSVVGIDCSKLKLPMVGNNLFW